MNLMDRLKSMFGGEERTYEYWCSNCEGTFESPKADMSAVNCPDCGSTRIRSSSTVTETAA